MAKVPSEPIKLQKQIAMGKSPEVGSGPSGDNGGFKKGTTGAGRPGFGKK